MANVSASAKIIEILLVEDNPGDIRLVQEALKESKITNNVQVVVDGFAAMEFLRGQGDFAGLPRPDLILLDLNLPKMDGRDILAEIKDDAVLRTIPVVILTSSDAEEDIVSTYAEHANCYIRKPVDFGQFVTVVKSITDFWFTIVELPRQKR